MEQLKQFHSLNFAVSSIFGNNVKIVRTQEMFGGDINKSYALTLSDGSFIFMKQNPGKTESFFTAEAEGL